MTGRHESLRDVRRDMIDKWSELVTAMSRYEKIVNETDGRGGKSLETDVVRLRVENEDLKIKVKVIENKWKQFKDEAIKNEVKLERRIKQLEGANKRLRETIDKGNPVPLARKSDKRLRTEQDDDDELSGDSDEKFGNVRVVSDPKRVRFHQAAIINGKRQRKPKFSHLQSDYAIDIQGMDKKLLDADDDIAGVGGEDDGEIDDEDDDEGWCDDCSKALGSAENLTRHLKDVHGILNPGSVFSCDKCDVVINSAVAYNRHMKLLHGLEEKPFACDVCNVSFATKQNLQSHLDLKVHDKKGITTKTIQEGFQDEIVMVESGGGSSKPMKRNVCPICFVVFPSSVTMNQHLKEHRLARSATTYACEYCEEVFYKKTALNEHESRCPKNKSEDEKLWETIVFPDAAEVLREQENYKDESLIDPILGPVDDYQGSITLTDNTANKNDSTSTKIMTEVENEKEVGTEETTSLSVVKEEVAEGQFETVSIVDESGQTLGQAQVSVDPVTGNLTYMAVDQNGEQLPLSRVLEGAGSSELLLSLVNQATSSKSS